MTKQGVFMRLWVYLKNYKSALFLAIFLKGLASVMSVAEPFILGLASTELTANLFDMSQVCIQMKSLLCSTCWT